MFLLNGVEIPQSRRSFSFSSLKHFDFQLILYVDDRVGNHRHSLSYCQICPFSVSLRLLFSSSIFGSVMYILLFVYFFFNASEKNLCVACKSPRVTGIIVLSRSSLKSINVAKSICKEIKMLLHTKHKIVV